MSGSTGEGTFRTYQGNNGDLLYKRLHEDVDVSIIEVHCHSGSCRLTLEEAIWWLFRTRMTWDLEAGDCLDETVEMDSELFDGDHRLSVVATADNTSVDVNWSSMDL